MPIYSPFYGATEGLIGVNLWPEEENPVYLLVPGAMFFEFIPVEESSKEQPTVSLCLIMMIFFRQSVTQDLVGLLSRNVIDLKV